MDCGSLQTRSEPSWACTVSTNEEERGLVRLWSADLDTCTVTLFSPTRNAKANSNTCSTPTSIYDLSLYVRAESMFSQKVHLYRFMLNPCLGCALLQLRRRSKSREIEAWPLNTGARFRKFAYLNCIEYIQTRHVCQCFCRVLTKICKTATRAYLLLKVNLPFFFLFLLFSLSCSCCEQMFCADDAVIMAEHNQCVE